MPYGVRGSLCWPVAFRHILPKCCFSPVGRRWRGVVSVFYTPAAKCVFNTSLISARHKLPAVDGALNTKGGSEPLMSSPHSDFTTLSLISSNEVCGEHEIAPRLTQDLPEKFSGRCWPRSPREIVFTRNSGKFQKIVLSYRNGSMGDRSGKVWLGSLGISHFWPSIVTGQSTSSINIDRRPQSHIDI